VAARAVVRVRTPLRRRDLAAAQCPEAARPGGAGLRSRPARRQRPARAHPGAGPRAPRVRRGAAARARSRLVGAGRGDRAALPQQPVRLGVRARQAAERPGLPRPARSPRLVARGTAARSRLRPGHRARAVRHRSRSPGRRGGPLRSLGHRGAGADRGGRVAGPRGGGAHRGGGPGGFRSPAGRPGPSHRRPALSRPRGAGAAGGGDRAIPRSRRDGVRARGGRLGRVAVHRDPGGRASRVAPARPGQAALPLPQRGRLDAPLRMGRDRNVVRQGVGRDPLRQRADRGGAPGGARRSVSGIRRGSAPRRGATSRCGASRSGSPSGPS
jgi:hypothetical protein